MVTINPPTFNSEAISSPFPPAPYVESTYVDNQVYPILLSVEGISGTGKTTLAKEIETYLKGRGVHVVGTHSPDYLLDGGQALREILSTGDKRCDPETISLFMMNQLENNCQGKEKCQEIMSIAPNEPILFILDRSTICGMAYSCNQQPEHLNDILTYYSAIDFPEFQILLLANDDVRKERMLRRPQQRPLLTPQVYQGTLQFMIGGISDEKKLVIDTNTMSLQEVGTLVHEFCEQKLIPILTKRAAEYASGKKTVMQTIPAPRLLTSEDLELIRNPRVPPAAAWLTALEN